MRRQRWRQRWRPAGGWPFYAVVLAAFFVVGVGGSYAYYQVSKPAQVKVITPPAQVIHTTIRPPVLPARTHYVTQPPVTVQPAYVPPVHAPAPSPTPTPSPDLTPGQANIPGVSGYVPPSTTGGDASPSTDNPTSGVTPPASPSSPSQGGA